MIKLVKEITKGLLEQEKKTIAVYGGGFKPPTKGHFEVVKRALDENPEIDEFLIYVGKKDRDNITQEDAVKIWGIYRNYLPNKVRIREASKPPIQEVYNIAKDNPEDEILWIIGAREENEDDFADIAIRTKSITKYPNLELRTIVTTGGVSGTAARNASKVSPEKLNKYLPDFLSAEEKNNIFVILSTQISEGDPKKGTGKKPKGSGRRLYTDEDPSDTVKVKFSTRQDVVDTLNKSSFKSKSHARQSQIINLIHQRVRAALSRTKDPQKKSKLRSAFEYIKTRKEASKKKTQRLKKQKTNEEILPQTNLVLPRGKKIILQAEEDDYDRGLIVELTEEGGYKIYYWYGEDIKVYPAEVEVDGESIKPDAKEVYIKFHPELEKENIDPKSQAKHKGKSAPYGSAYEKVKEGDTIEKYSAKGKATGKLKQGTVRKRLNIPKDKKIPISLINKELSRLRKMDKDPDKKGAQLGDKNQKYYKALQLAKTLKTTTNVNENAQYSQHIDIKQKIKELTQHMIDKGMNIEPLPKVIFKNGNAENAKQFLGRTAYYDPNLREIVLYTEGRHPKDIVRSFSHEMIHHIQNLENRLGNVTTTNTTEDEYLTQLEAEANLKGTMTFRGWTDSLQEGKNKDPFGLNAYAAELARLREEDQDVKIYLDMDGVIADFEQRFEDLSGMSPQQFEAKYGKDLFWDFIDEGNNKVRFWVGIPLMEGAKRLVDYVSKHNYVVLTAPSIKKQSRLGKALWIKNKVGELFPSKPTVIFKAAKEKHRVKPSLTEKDILIDDKASTINNWNNAGGTGILYTSSDQAISELKKLGL